MIEAFRKGTDPVPLAYLVDEFLDRHDASRLTYRNGILEHPEWNEPEDGIGLAQGIGAIKRHNALMLKYWPERAEFWSKFWNVLFLQSAVSEDDWLIKRELAAYHIQLCVPHADKSGEALVPDPYDQRAMDRAIAKVNSKSLVRLKAVEKALETSKTDSHAASSAPKGSKGSSYTSYSSSKSSPQTKVKGEGEGSVCFVCRVKGHPSRNCSSKKQYDNVEVNVKKDSNNNWVLYDGTAFCWSFNSAKGCTRKDCHNGVHVCTGCLSKSHGAQTCKRGAN